MIKKIEDYLKKKQEDIKKENDLKKAQTYYNLVKAGGAFINFIQQDMKKNQDQKSRAERRRMEKDLEKGILSDEIVKYYQQRIDYVLGNIYMRLNPTKVQSNPNVQISKEKPPDA